MSDTLALEWEHEQVSGVLATVAGGEVVVRQSFVIPRKTATGGDAGLAPDWLRQELVRLGVGSPSQVLVTLPRDDAFVRRLELPEVPDEELPAIVRFQMGTKSSVSMDEQSLDFIPLVKRSEIPGREVLAATVPQELLKEIQQQCQGLNATLVGVGLAATAIAELVVRAEAGITGDRSGVSLVVGRFAHRLEIAVYRLGGVFFAHAARLSAGVDGEPQSIVPEVSRALVALRGALSDLNIERVWTLVSPAEQETVGAALERRLNCEVRPLNAWEMVSTAGAGPEQGEKSQFAGPLGMLLSRAAPRALALDFLNPRKTVVKPDNRKRNLQAVGLGAGALVASLLGYQMWTVSHLDAEIEQLKFKDNQLAAEIKKAKPIENSVALIEKWRADNVDWLDQMRDLVERMPPTERIYLESLQLTRVGSQPPKLIAHGFAREQKDVMDLSSALHTSDRYRVMPYQASKTAADSFYPWRIDGQEILLAEPEKPKPGTKGKGAASQTTSKPTAAKPTAAKSPAKASDEAAPADPPAAAEKSQQPADEKAIEEKITEKPAAISGDSDKVASESKPTPTAKEDR
jgi:Tfp pilus assembly PilM family ATPase/FtsZ-binding cell division protein ZapB